MGDGPAGLAGPTLRGVAWNVAGTVASQALRLLSMVVIARALAPEDFAIAGQAVAVIGLFQALTVEGFAQALVRRRTLEAITVDSVFWPLAVGAVLLGGGAALVASPIAAWYEQPALSVVLPVLAVGLVFGMVGAVPHALLQREFRFRAINFANLAAALVTAAGGVALALTGQGYHALIAPVAAGFVARAAVLFVASGYRPSFAFARSELASVGRFGFAQLGSTVLGAVNDNGDYLVMSRVWPQAAFGQYYFAFERARQPFELLFPQLAAVLFPSFSQLQDTGDRLRDAYLNTTRAFGLLVYLPHALLLLLADPLLPWVFGSQWEPAVPIFRIFLCFGFVRTFAVAVPPLLLARDRAHFNLAFNAFRAVVILPLLAVLAFLGADVLTTATALLVVWTLQAPVYVGMALRELEIGFADAWRGMRGVVLSTVVAAAAGFGSRWIAAAWSWSAWLDVLACTITTVAVFGAMNRARLLDLARLVSSQLRPAAIRRSKASP